ncbi:MAG: 50S ribosomal protein L13 [Candidatus Caldarchaeum sp.]|nr:50S ribosomal protein L13 [Candidatus Caldarchaeum sp.]MDW7978642.1 50S ribosomal protein L13 [Candidatus Caldarchaeum sp.]MDW8360006.1 50S ribosomal protein L13 [Candidatus Caldarchaeum sp.]
MDEKTYVINAEGYRLGRLASKIAKLLLEGHRVKVFNAEKALITGTKSSILEHYLMLRRRRQFTSHKKITVWYPTGSEAILRYTVLRMLPRKKPRGIEAGRRLEVFRGPANVSGELIEFPDAKHSKPISRSGKYIRAMTVGELSKQLKGGAE